MCLICFFFFNGKQNPKSERENTTIQWLGKGSVKGKENLDISIFRILFGFYAALSRSPSQNKPTKRFRHTFQYDEDAFCWRLLRREVILRRYRQKGGILTKRGCCIKYYQRVGRDTTTEGNNPCRRTPFDAWFL